MNHPVISVFSICSRETMLNVHLHILSTFKVHIGKPKFRPLMGVNPSFSPPTSFRTKHVHVKSVFLSATYSLLHWRVWIWIFFCSVRWSVTSRNSTHCHLRVSFPLWSFHSDKLHVVVFIKAKRHSLSHLSCNAHLQRIKTGEKNHIISSPCFKELSFSESSYLRISQNHSGLMIVILILDCGILSHNLKWSPKGKQFYRYKYRHPEKNQLLQLSKRQSYPMARWGKPKGFYGDPHNVAHQRLSWHTHNSTQPMQEHLFWVQEAIDTHKMLQSSEVHCTSLALLCGKSIQTSVCPRCQGRSRKNRTPRTTNLHHIAHCKNLTAFEPSQRTEGLNFQLTQPNWTENWTENWKKEQTNTKTVTVLPSETSRTYV